MKSILPFLFIPLIISACSTNYVIDGSSAMSNFDGKMIFVKVHQDNQWVAVDSAEIIHGLFSIKGHADSTVMATLYMDQQSIMPMVLENGKIKISLAYNELSARGTPLNDALYDFIQKKEEYEESLYQLERQEARLVMDGRDVDEVQAELAEEGERLLNELNSFVKKFIVDNGDNVLGPYVFLMLSNSLPYPLLTPQIEDILQDAPYSLKSHKLVKEYINKAKENMELIREHRRMEYGNTEK